MKTFFLCLAILATGMTLCAQVKPKPPVKTTKVTPPVLKNAKDSASYAAGMFVVNHYGQYGLKDFNPAMIAKAVADMQSQKPLLNEQSANSSLMNYYTQIMKSKAKPNIAAGDSFLVKNKKRQGVITTASGLQYEIITTGAGATPTRNDTVVMNYHGKLLNGFEFDNSYTRGVPLTIKAGDLVAGMTEALMMMPIGSKWKLYIPYNLGYGVNDNAAIPAGSTLIFELELLDIKKPVTK